MTLPSWAQGLEEQEVFDQLPNETGENVTCNSWLAKDEDAELWQYASETIERISAAEVLDREGGVGMSIPTPPKHQLRP